MKTLQCSVLILGCLLWNAPLVCALPEGEQVVAGQATFDRSQAGSLRVHQTSDKMIAEYQSFSVARPEAVYFQQPSSVSTALNRVVGGRPSEILGTLTSTGRVFLVNPSGVLFGPHSRVDTSGLVASTLNIANGDFMAGRYTFFGSGGHVVNQGYIASPGGFVSLMGSHVKNEGVIEAQLGTVALAAGEKMTLQLDSEGIISVAVDEPVMGSDGIDKEALDNTGDLLADGGKVILSAKALDGVFDRAINTQGLIEADALDGHEGEIVLVSDQRVRVAGTISAKGGTLSVDAQGADFAADVDVREARYNMNDGDTDITGGTFSGDQTFTDNLNISVSGPVIVDAGSLRLLADNDNNGSGDLSVQAGLTVTGNTLLLQGENIDVRFATLELNGDNPFGAASGIEMRAGEDINLSYSRVTSRTAGGGEQFVRLSAGNDVDVEYSDINADVGADGDSTVELTADRGEVLVASQGGPVSHLKALVRGDGDAAVSLTASGPQDKVVVIDSDILARVYGDGDALIALTGQTGISIPGSTFTAGVDGTGGETFEVVVNQGDIEQAALDGAAAISADTARLEAENDVGSAGDPVILSVNTLKVLAHNGTNYVLSTFAGEIIDLAQTATAGDASDPEISLQLVHPLRVETRSNYQFLNYYRVSSVSSLPLGYYAYHPLTPTDTSSIDEIILDIEAYEFIEGDIQLKKPLNPYLGTEG